jgi:diadenosine tetraphosphate (Ap4A) HIT family hydrolase
MPPVMQTVFEATHFVIIVPARPHVSRLDGGHLVINPKVPVLDRTQLTREQAIELVKLTMVAGAAMQSVLPQRGVDIWRINYQDNGNWRPELHVHLYGRAKSSTLQPYGHFLSIPLTAEAFKQQPDLEPFNAEDVAALSIDIERLLATEKFRSF